MLKLTSIFNLSYNIGTLDVFLDYLKQNMQNASNSRHFIQLLKKNCEKISEVLEKIMKGLRLLDIMEETQSEIIDYCKKTNKFVSGKDIFKTTNDLLRFTDSLSTKIDVWNDRIFWKLNSINIFQLTTESNLNTEKLSIGAKSFFNEDIWYKMQKIEQEDLADGCRCLSLQAWTPAAMITIRVIESLLGTYFKNQTGNDLPDKPTMGSLIKQLEKNPNADQEFIGYFNYLRTVRNKLQHPDTRFTQFEAEDIFNQAIHIINQVYS